MAGLILCAGGCASASRSVAEAGDERGISIVRAIQDGDVAHVPGLEFASVSPRDRDDERARVTADDVLRELRTALPWPLEAAEQSEDADVPREALMRYLRGREARQEGRFDEAARVLDAARQLDPDAPRILLELGRAVGGLGDAALAMELFRRVLELEPLDPFAAMMVMGEDVQQGRFREALERYAQMTRDVDRFEHDAAASLLAEDMLRMALLGLGYDRAAVEVTAELLLQLRSFDDLTGYQVALGQMMEQRGRMAIESVDACLRLRDLDAAEWFAGLAAQFGDTDRYGLGSRLVAIRLLRGDVAGLLRELGGRWSMPDAMLLDRDVRLAVYLRDSVADTTTLAATLRDSINSAGASVMRLRVAAAATMNPAEARSLLEEAARRSPRDTGVLRDRIDLARREGPTEVQRLAESLLSLVPERARSITDAFARGLRFPSQGNGAIGAARTEELHIRLIARFGDLGGAWRRAQAAAERHPTDPGLRRLQIELAGELDEPELLLPLISGVSVEPYGSESAVDLWTRLLIADALLRLGRSTEAAEYARAVRFKIERAADARGSRDAWVLARARLIEARSFADQAMTMDIGPRRTSIFAHASRLANEARMDDPQMREAVSFLLSLHRPMGPMPDPQRLAALFQDLSRDPQTLPAAAVVLAADYLQTGQLRRSVQYAEFAISADMLDDEAVGTLVRAKERLDQHDLAERALRARIARWPGDIASIDQLLGLLVRSDDHRSAQRFLDARLEDRPGDRFALGRLEVLARARGLDDEALRLGLQRVQTLPPGSRQRLQKASLLVQSGEGAQAVEVLAEIAADPTAPPRHLTFSMSLLGQIPRPEEEADRVTVRAAERLLDDESLQGRAEIPSAALASLARLGRLDEVFDRMVRAIMATSMARDPGTGGVLQLRELAQRLVFAGSVPAAARLLEARLLSDAPLATEALVVLASMQLLADAASDPDGMRVVALLDRLQMDGMLGALPGLDGVESLPDAIFIGSQIAMLTGNDDGAEALLERVLELDPSISMAKNNLAYMQIELGRADRRTIDLAREAGRLHPDDQSVRDTVAWLDYHLENFEAAEQELAALCAKPDASSDVFDHWGDALYRLGREGEAIAAWRAGIERVGREWGSRLEALERFRALQVRGWGLLVVEPEVLYHQQIGVSLERMEAKIAAVVAGSEPMVTPTFVERGDRFDDVDTRQPVAGSDGGP